MILKRLILYNLIFSIVLIIYFYFRFNLNWFTIPIHLILVFYGILLLASISILLAKLSIKKIAKPIITVLIASGNLFIIVVYFLFFLSIENWGNPITIKLLSVYIKEIDFLFESLPISKKISGITVLTPIIIISTVYISFSDKLYYDFHNLSWRFLSFKPRLKTAMMILIIFIPFFCIIVTDIEEMLFRTSKIKYDPIISLFYYRAQREEIVSGIDNVQARQDYPNNLSFEKKNIILIVCDALRSDHLSLYDYSRNTSPFLDSLCSSSNAIKVNHFYSTSSRSLVGISNILSSTYNYAHNNFFIHDLLHKQGYRINFILSGDQTNFYGLRKHFGEYIHNYCDGFILNKLTKKRISINDDKEVVLGSLKKMPDFDGIPSFFYLHFMSTHQIGICDTKFIKYKPNRITKISIADSSTLINDYDNKITQLDSYLKKAFGYLDAKGYLKHAIVIITSDHGQALMENGKYWHGKSTYLTEISIPFLLIETDNFNIKNKKTASYANQVDIAPTILDLLQLPIPETWQGHSIFEKRTEPVFQHERNYYSAVFMNGKILTHFVYNNQTKIKELYEITIRNRRGKDLTNLIKQEENDSIWSIVANFYSLN